MYKYKNISDQDLVIIGVGEVKAGKIIESEVILNNSNLQIVGDERKIGIDPVTKLKK